MNKFIIPLVAFALLVVVLAVGVKRSPENTIVPSALVGHPAPEFNLPELLEPGTTVSSSALKGKPYVINVWATWCVTCRIEHPVLVQLKQLGQVPIIGINWRDEDDLARQWLSEFGNPYAHVPVDKEGRTIIDLGVTGAPETFLVNSKGIIVHRHVGALSLDAWKKDFEPLIRADLGTASNAAGSAAPGPT